MSFASSMAVPANAAIDTARALLRGRTLHSMARGVGVVVGAGVLAASYQIAYDEGRQILTNLRTGAQARRARNDAVVLALMNTVLPVQVLDNIRRSRDAMRTSMALVTDPVTPDHHRETIRKTLVHLTGADASSN